MKLVLVMVAIHKRPPAVIISRLVKKVKKAKCRKIEVEK